MASYSKQKSTHQTLAGTTADQVTILGGPIGFEIFNRDAAQPLWFTWTTDGTTPTVAVAAADGTDYVPASTSKHLFLNQASLSTLIISIVGNGNAYSVIPTFEA